MVGLLKLFKPKSCRDSPCGKVYAGCCYCSRTLHSGLTSHDIRHTESPIHC